MGLETAVNISDLVIANPTGADPKSQGDDHIRNIKATLKNAFAGFAGSVIVTGTDGGAANAYTLTPATVLPAYGNKMIAVFAPTVANTGACTLNISALGVKALVSVAGAPLVAGELAVGTIYSAQYDGTQFRLTSITKQAVDQMAFASALPEQTLGFLGSSGTTAAFTKTHTGYAQNEVLGAAIASAATINLTTATGNLVHITGTTTITAITIPAGAERTVIFDGALTLTHGAALLLPGAENIATADGDRMIVRGDTAGAVVVSYFKASGKPLLTGVQLFTSSGPFTPIPGVTSYIVEIVGGGGGGGGGSAYGGTTGTGGGGGLPGTRTVVDVISLSAAVSVVIGAGGAGGAAVTGSSNGLAGGVGGTSSFGAHASAAGGAGGGGGLVDSLSVGSAGSAAVFGAGATGGTGGKYDGSDSAGNAGGAGYATAGGAAGGVGTAGGNAPAVANFTIPVLAGGGGGGGGGAEVGAAGGAGALASGGGGGGAGSNAGPGGGVGGAGGSGYIRITW